MKTFVKWWFYFMLILIGGIFSFYLGLIHRVIDDSSWIGIGFCSLITVIFSYMTIKCGIGTWSFCRKKYYLQADKMSYEQIVNSGFFAGDQCENIGMIGTIAGMCMVLLCFESVDVENISTVQDLIHSLGPGLATAFYTTLLGLVGSSLLKQQYFNLSQAIDNEIVD
jgi:hypothetical protein